MSADLFRRESWDQDILVNKNEVEPPLGLTPSQEGLRLCLEMYLVLIEADYTAVRLPQISRIIEVPPDEKVELVGRGGWTMTLVVLSTKDHQARVESVNKKPIYINQQMR